MRFSLLVMTAGAMLLAGGASAQVTAVDTFETYGDSLALLAEWNPRGFAGEDAILQTDGGADGTANYMRITDGGFSYIFTAADLATPTAGAYVFSFWYRNGTQPTSPFAAMSVSLNQDGSAVFNTTLQSVVVGDWTLVQSGEITLTNTPLSISISGTNGAEAGAPYNADFDQFILTDASAAPLSLSVVPDEQIILSGQEVITALPSAGTSPYTVIFDVNNDTTADFTDTTPPYEFNWDTTSVVPVDTSNTITLRVGVTDNASATDEVILDYVIDNEFGGRESLIVNGNFDQFQTADTEGNQLPVGWIEFQHDANPTNATYGPGPGRNAGAGQALQINYVASDFTNRYTVRTEPITVPVRDLQTTFFGNGSSCRLFYAISVDDGATFVPQTGIAAAEANSPGWVFDFGPPQTFGSADQISLATHQFNAGIHLWDDITFEGNILPGDANVEGWNLY